MHVSPIGLRAFFFEKKMQGKELEIDLYHEVIEGTSEVFSSMLMVELESGPPIYSNRVDIESNISSMIGLGNGIRGVVAVHCPEKTAKKITSGFLGMEIESLDDDVKDAIGEIANMVAGNLKISFAKADVDIQIAIPTTIIGESFRYAGFSRAICIAVPFTMDDEVFWIELKYIKN